MTITDTKPTVPPGLDYTSGLERELAIAKRDLEAARQDLVDFKKRVVDVSREYAENHDMCSVYDDCMDELGLPHRERDYEFVVEVTYRQTLLVKSTSEDEAETRVHNLTTSRTWSPSLPFTQEGIEAADTPWSITVALAD